MLRGRLIRGPRLETPPHEPARLETTAHALPARPELPHAATSRAEPRRTESQRTTHDVAATLELAQLLAERIVGEAFATDERALAHYALSLLDEARGAQELALYAHPLDVARLERALAAHDFDGRELRILGDATLTGHELRVETELGSVVGAPRESLARLTEAARAKQKHEP